MSRAAFRFSAVSVILLLTALLAACGSDKKEGGSPETVALVSETTCRVCHATNLDPLSGRGLVAGYLNSPHNRSDAGCQGCHGGGAQHFGVGPIPFPNPVDRCNVCHNGTLVLGNDVVTFDNDADIRAQHLGTFLPSANGPGNCGVCHNPHDPLNAPFVGGSCIACHAFGQDETDKGTYVNDNNGVRAILPEFAKRSHHITGAAPTDAQCAVCHLEGKPNGAGGVTINVNFHMKDDKIHLRDLDHGGAGFVWDGSDHTAMDNFCFSCHDADGASDLVTLKALIPTATANNPFADTLTNGYDQVARARVADVKTAFTTSNASHHAVSGQRYKYRFSTLANAQAWAARTGNPVPPASQIAENHVGEASPNGGTITAFDPADTMTGEFRLPTNQLAAGGFAAPAGEGEATLYEASKFVATYIPLGATQNVADNSILHCGDCHTVGQWKPGSSTSADGSATPVAIGAHGSANEYLLRNSLGTDQIHNSLTYVCFNCHVAGVAPGLTAGKAGFGALHPNQNKNQIMGYATAHSVSAMHIQCLADSASNVGGPNRLVGSFEGDKVAEYDYVPAPGATAILPVLTVAGIQVPGTTDPFIDGSDANSGNITGIACINCHNAGLRSSFGGIHGGDNTYQDGLGRTQKTYRFMPGMGNYRYAPPGGWDGKDTSDSTLLTQASSGVGAGKPMGGCYTNNSATENAGFSACSHHGTSTAQTTAAGQAAGFRATYGGGTAATPTAAEPTVREATAGNALVTRPLQY